MGVKVSIAIPIFNTGAYLKKCLESVINQTLSEIEIICVNDGSTDDSLDILNNYASKDSRIKIIDFGSNKSLLQARKVAVMQATGKYMMFLDSDDWLELNACEYLYGLIEQKNVDILHFGTYVDSLPEVDLVTKTWFENFAHPYNGYLYDDEITLCSFKEKKIIWSIWNKIYKSEVCKNAYQNIDDMYQNMCEDMYCYFLISWYADSYFGISDKFYHYNYGRGLTGIPKLLKQNNYYDLCNMSSIVNNLQRFLENKNELDKYRDVLFNIKRDYLYTCLGGLCSLDDTVDKAQCMGKFVSCFGKVGAYNEIINKLNYQNKEISHYNDKLKESEAYCEMLQGTLSWRIGRFITYIPRKIREVLKLIYKC